TLRDRPPRRRPPQGGRGGRKSHMRKVAVLAALALLGLVAAGPARAWGAGPHGGWHGGTRHRGPRNGHWPFVVVPDFYVGGPYGGPYWWGAPYGYGWYGYPYPYAYGPPVVVQSAPQVYVQPAAPAQQYWYYCQNPAGYYPSVGQCPS